MQNELIPQLKARRKALGFTQRELAPKIGITANTLNRLEAGRFPPKLDTLLRWVDALDAEIIIKDKGA